MDDDAKLAKYQRMKAHAQREISFQSEMNKQRSQAVLQRHYDMVEAKKQHNLDKIQTKDTKLDSLRRQEQQAQRQISKIKFENEIRKKNVKDLIKKVQILPTEERGQFN